MLNFKANISRSSSWILPFFLILIACGEKQDHLISAPQHPLYTMYGTVTADSTDLPFENVQVDIIMTEVYQGEFLDPQRTYTDSIGYYEKSGLYRGRYTIIVQDSSDTLFIGEAGIIKYEDKQFDIVIISDTTSAPPDTTLK